ncbi:MAG: thioredoxin [Patescibacteria group bacterium]
MENIFTEQNFDTEVLKSSTPVFVDFWAPWCGPCRATSPIVEELAGEIDAAKLKIGKVNVDENGNLAQTYNVLSIPTFIVFKDGKEDTRFSGGMGKEDFLAKLARYIG